jgi:hypothetical protein
VHDPCKRVRAYVAASFVKASKSMYTYISLEMVYTPLRVRKYVPRYGSTCATPGPSVPEVSSYISPMESEDGAN